MTNKALYNTLKRIEKDVQLALKTLEGELPVVGICVWCKQPIYQGQGVVRGVHQNTCYSFAQSRVADGDTTWETLEQEGKVLPKATPGRKKLSPEEHRQRVAAEEAGTQIAKKSRKSRKKQQE